MAVASSLDPYSRHYWKYRTKRKKKGMDTVGSDVELHKAYIRIRYLQAWVYLSMLTRTMSIDPKKVYLSSYATTNSMQMRWPALDDEV